VMSGYWKDPHGSQRALTEDGGMRTGDVGRVDAHGRVHITGRLATDYKLDNGWRVAPIAVEETLLLSPFIAQVFVSGSARPYNVALVVPEDVALARWADARSLVCEAEASLHAPEVRQLLEAEVVSVHAPCFLITKGIDGRIRS
jgi:long-chain acyl-CoA synthetase